MTKRTSDCVDIFYTKVGSLVVTAVLVPSTSVFIVPLFPCIEREREKQLVLSTMMQRALVQAACECVMSSSTPPSPAHDSRYSEFLSAATKSTDNNINISSIIVYVQPAARFDLPSAASHFFVMDNAPETGTPQSLRVLCIVKICNIVDRQTWQL